MFKKNFVNFRITWNVIIFLVTNYYGLPMSGNVTILFYILTSMHKWNTKLFLIGIFSQNDFFFGNMYCYFDSKNVELLNVVCFYRWRREILNNIHNKCNPNANTYMCLNIMQHYFKTHTELSSIYIYFALVLFCYFTSQSIKFRFVFLSHYLKDIFYETTKLEWKVYK